MIRFYIVIPVHNRVRRTVNVLRCLQRQTYQHFTAYVVDDGSTDGTAERVREEFGSTLDLRILFGDGNLWWSGATHLGIETALQHASDDDVIVMMNDDIEFHEDFLSRAAEVATEYPETVFGPLVVDDSDRETLCKSGAIMISWPLALSYRPFEGRKLSKSSAFPAIHDVDFLRAQATFVPVRIVRQIGNVQIRLLPHYHADGEYTYRAKRAGFNVFISRDLVVFHSVGSTGSFNVFSGQLTLRDFLRSLRDIRSPNAVKYKLRFAWLCCPRIYFIPFMVSDTIKVVARSLGYLLFGERIVRLRWLASRLLARTGTGG
ncbi:MAG: glycosyltransferase family 2 protein [Ardenticatenaceae bacterium]|nr:glycosyltransferase family 2 protein [Ardenticatenaceae bacterium]